MVIGATYRADEFDSTYFFFTKMAINWRIKFYGDQLGQALWNVRKIALNILTTMNFCFVSVSSQIKRLDIIFSCCFEIRIGVKGSGNKNDFLRIPTYVFPEITY